MKAVVFHGIGDIRLDEVPEPIIQAETDALVQITASAICGTDLHLVRGTMPGMEPGTILGHEGVGIVTEVGRQVRNVQRGDRVIIPSTIACGYCSYCRAGYYAQCDNANPNGPLAGTAFYGGPKESGPFQGLQAEYARVPFAATNLIQIPDVVSDDQAVMLSDIVPTGYFGADLAKIKPGHSVAIFGCGPVGQFAIISAQLMGAGRVFAIDTLQDRLAAAQMLGAEIIDYNAEDPVEMVRQLTGGIGVDCAIDAVGVDANHPHRQRHTADEEKTKPDFRHEVARLASHVKPSNQNWHPGDAPSQATEWAAESLAKAGTLAIIGVYPLTDRFFPIGLAMNKNLTLHMGNCNHRKYIPHLLDLVRTAALDPTMILSQVQPMVSAIDAYKAFDQRQPGWLKVELLPPVVTVADMVDDAEIEVDETMIILPDEVGEEPGISA